MPDTLEQRPRVRPLPLPIGTCISDRYRVAGTVVVGGLGWVHRAYDEVLERMVAITDTPPDEAGPVLAAARTATRFRHPALLAVHDAIEESGRAFVVSDFVDGVTLEALVDTIGPRPPAEVLANAQVLSEALAEIHRADIVHGGVCPANIVRTEGGKLLLLHFAPSEHDESFLEMLDAAELAADGERATHRVLFESATQASSEETSAEAERRGGFDRRIVYERRVGLAGRSVINGLLPPEVQAGGPLSTAADVYGLASTLYFLATGEGLPSTEDRAAGAAVEPVHVLNPIYPEWFSVVLDRALSVDPDDRPATAPEFAELLATERERALHAEPVASENGWPEAAAFHQSLPFNDDALWEPVASPTETTGSRRNLLAVPLVVATIATVLMCAFTAWRVTDKSPRRSNARTVVAPVTNPNTPKTSAVPVSLARATPGKPAVVSSTRPPVVGASVRTRPVSPEPPTAPRVSTSPVASVPTASVPNVVGFTVAEALRALAPLDLAVRRTVVVSQDAAPGLVVSQRPRPGAAIEPGSVLELQIAMTATTAPTATIPATGQTAATAPAATAPASAVRDTRPGAPITGNLAVWTVALSTVPNPADASALVAELSGRGFADSHVTELRGHSSLPAGGWLVSVGVFGTDEPARTKATELAALGYASTARCIGSDAACIDLSPPSESRWTVRVHRAATLGQAKALGSLFVPRFGDVFVGRIVERMPDGGQWFVDVGLPITRAEAEALAEKVRADGAVADAVVVCRSTGSTDCV